MNHTHIALAVFLGCLLVAGAIVAPRFTKSESSPATSVSREEFRHLYGNPEAGTVIVEFSDLECPFCARLHPTLRELVDTSGGAVAWEYRHYPIPNHPHAYEAAVISECVAEELGTQVFFTYLDQVFAQVSSLNSLSLQLIAKNLGLSDSELTRCQNDTAIKDRIAADMATATAEGARGTPHSVIVAKDGTSTPVSGALPKEQWLNLLQLSQ